MKKRAFIAVILSVVFLSSCSNKPQELLALNQDSEIQVYFNHNQSQEYTDSYRNIKRKGDNLEAVIIDNINSATKTIDIAVQEFNLKNIAEAIVNKQKQGIKIRIVIENTYNYPNPRANKNLALKILQNAQIPLIDDKEDGSKGTGLMHHKFMVIDGKKVITGSTNYALSDIHGDFNNPETRGNANHILVINNNQVADIFTEEFNYLWGDGVGNKKDSLFGVEKPERKPQIVQINNSQITIKFSPNSQTDSFNETSNGLISKTLEKSEKTIDLALFVFSDQTIANTLEKESLNQVQIRGLIDPIFAYQYYSEGLDLLGITLPDNKCRYEKNNQPWKKGIETVGFPNLVKGDKLHHKFAIIDENTIITGSHNWSNAANYLNDETLLIISNPLIAQHFQEEFNGLYGKASLGISPVLKEKMKEAKQQCQSRIEN